MQPKNFKKGKGKGQKAKIPQEGKNHKDPRITLRLKRGSLKAKTKSKRKRQWLTWSWNQNRSQNQSWPNQSDRKRHKAKWRRKGQLSSLRKGKSSSSSTLAESKSSTRTESATIISESNISEFAEEQTQTLQPDQLRGFQDLWPVAQQQYQSILQSHVSNNYGSMSSVRHHPVQIEWFEQHRLNIIHFIQPLNPDVQIQEVCLSFPYPIGPSLPQHLQESWAALIDAGTVTSAAPSSLAPHVANTLQSASGQLVNVNGGETKVQGQKKVTYITHKIVMNITFLSVKDVVNLIICLDALHKMQFHSMPFRSQASRMVSRRSSRILREGSQGCHH